MDLSEVIDQLGDVSGTLAVVRSHSILDTGQVQMLREAERRVDQVLKELTEFNDD